MSRGGEEERKKGGQEEKRGKNRRGEGEERIRGRGGDLVNTLQAALAHSLRITCYKMYVTT